MNAMMQPRVPDYILDIEPYEPGKPLEELEREYGIKHSIKLASNENPLGPSPMAMSAVNRSLKGLHRYPDGAGFALTRRIAARFSVKPQQIVIGNGSDDLIGMLTRALLQPGDEVVLASPSFLMYEIMVRSVGAVPVITPLAGLKLDLAAMADAMSPQTRMAFICNPNNPTGTVVSKDEFQAFLDRIPRHVVVVVDEAYMEFVRDPDCAKSLEFIDGDRIVVMLRTFSKDYGLAGLRVGYGVMPGNVAELLHRIRQPFNASTLAQVGALAALDDDGFLNKTIRLVHQGLDMLYGELERMGLDYFATQSNFFLIDLGRDADRVFDAMLREGVIVRSMTAYGFPQYIRINVGLPSENQQFIAALERVLNRG